MIAIFDPLGEIDLLRVGQQRSLGDLAEVEADRVVDEIGIESLKHIEIPFEIELRLLRVAGHLGLNFFRDIDFIFLTDRFGDQGVNLANIKRLQRITH